MGGSGNHMEQGTTGGCPYDDVAVGALVVTPNHIHGIIVVVGAAPRGRPNIFKMPPPACVHVLSLL